MIFVFLMKPFLLALFSIVNRKDRSAIINMFYPDKIILSSEALAAIPVFFLMLAWLKRSSDALDKYRVIWKNGKRIIIGTAILQLLVTTSPFWLLVDADMTRYSWAQAAIYVFVIMYTIFSTYMTDCFDDFPEPAEDSVGEK
jgi:peptidoglycan biosynthesis protein MviN/MurJ (putative lipid II flippase)